MQLMDLPRRGAGLWAKPGSHTGTKDEVGALAIH